MLYKFCGVLRVQSYRVYIFLHPGRAWTTWMRYLAHFIAWAWGWQWACTGYRIRFLLNMFAPFFDSKYILDSKHFLSSELYTVSHRFVVTTKMSAYNNTMFTGSARLRKCTLSHGKFLFACVCIKYLAATFLRNFDSRPRSLLLLRDFFKFLPFNLLSTTARVPLEGALFACICTGFGPWDNIHKRNIMYSERMRVRCLRRTPQRCICSFVCTEFNLWDKLPQKECYAFWTDACSVPARDTVCTSICTGFHWQVGTSKSHP